MLLKHPSPQGRKTSVRSELLAALVPEEFYDGLFIIRFGVHVWHSEASSINHSFVYILFNRQPTHFPKSQMLKSTSGFLAVSQIWAQSFKILIQLSTIGFVCIFSCFSVITSLLTGETRIRFCHSSRSFLLFPKSPMVISFIKCHLPKFNEF